MKVSKNSLNPNSLDLLWNSPSINCDPNVSYGIFRGLIPTLQDGNYDYTALICNVNSTSITIQDPGPMSYLLVITHTSSSQGSYGRTSSGIERPQSFSPCNVTLNNTAC